MNKFLAYIILFLATATAGGVIYIAASAHGAEDNYFNKNLRHKLARHNTLRTLFRLHYDGDGRAEYLGNSSGIGLRIGSVGNSKIPDEAVWQELIQKIETGLEKRTSYELTGIAGETVEQTYFSLKAMEKDEGTAYVYVVVESRDPENPNSLGVTLMEDGIELYTETLALFTINTPRTFDTYTMSTLLHEFGHQLGLPHNSEPGCLMNEHAESDGIPKSHPSLTAADFCSLEKEQIKTITY